MFSIEGLRGVVMETYGAGNAPTGECFLRTVGEAIRRGIVVLNVTRCASGNVTMERYETGLELQRLGVLSGHDMTTEAAVTKLMYVLGKNGTPEASSEQLKLSLRGEFTA